MACGSGDIIWAEDVEDGVDSGNAVGPGAAEEFEEDGLCLVVASVRGEDAGGGAAEDEVFKDRVAGSAGGLFEGLAVSGGAGGDVCLVKVEGDGEAGTESFDEVLVAVGGLAADAVVDVNRGEADAEGLAGKGVGVMESEEEGDGVGAAGEGDGDAVAGVEVGAVEGQGRGGGHAGCQCMGVRSPGVDRGRRCVVRDEGWGGAWYTQPVMRVFVIVPAAGIGTRMVGAGPAPKQFLELAGVPVLVHTVRAFLAVARVDAVCIAVRGAERERMQAQMVEYRLGPRVHLVEGGDHRQESVGNALAALECDADDVVLVHDAVRPLIDAATIERTIDAVMRHGAAIVGLPAVDTIKQVERTADGAIVTATIPRERVVLAQTPQGALAGLLRRAYAEAQADEFAGTDEASLLERAGVEVAVVAGSARNFKITQAGDLDLAEFYLETTMPAGVR